NPPAGRAHHLRHDGKPANRAAAAVDDMPAFLHTGPAEGRPGHLPGGLSDAQQPPKILIAAIEDVAPDPLGDRFSHGRPPLLPRAREDLSCNACALLAEDAAPWPDTPPARSLRTAKGRLVGVPDCTFMRQPPNGHLKCRSLNDFAPAEA